MNELFMVPLLDKVFDLMMVFDVESIGLHGEAYAVGWTIIENGHEVDFGHAATHPDNALPSMSASPESIQNSRKWLQDNVEVPSINASTTLEVREAFWREWTKIKNKGGSLWSEVNWPVESNFLSACIEDNHEEREWNGPYPLFDIGNLRRIMNISPATVVFKSWHAGRPHNPLFDCRQSAKYIVGLGREIGAI